MDSFRNWLLKRWILATRGVKMSSFMATGDVMDIRCLRKLASNLAIRHYTQSRQSYLVNTYNEFKVMEGYNLILNHTFEATIPSAWSCTHDVDYERLTQRKTLNHILKTTKYKHSLIIVKGKQPSTIFMFIADLGFKFDGKKKVATIIRNKNGPIGSKFNL